MQLSSYVQWTTVECDDCGLVLMAFESLGPSPVGRDDCPECGGTAFSFLV